MIAHTTRLAPRRTWPAANTASTLVAKRSYSAGCWSARRSRWELVRQEALRPQEAHGQQHQAGRARPLVDVEWSRGRPTPVAVTL